MGNRFASAAVATASLLWCGAARAEPPSATQRAEQLFDAGKESMEAGDFADACPQLAQSEALDPQPGTLLNLATCYEGLGRTASAWLTWLRAADAAAAKGQSEREAFARYSAHQLEPRLLRVTLRVAEQPAPEHVVLTLDGATLARGEHDPATVSRPMDPGEHELGASGEGLRPWSSRFVVDEQHTFFAVPVLEPIHAAAVATATTPDRRAPVLVPLAWTVGGLGVAALGVGAAFGVAAIVNENTATAGGDCKPNNACNAAGTSARNRSRQDAQLADVTFAVGGGALVTAVALWLVARESPAHPSPRARVVVQPSVARGAWSLSVDGAW
jgi:hypothetical protein